MYHVTDGIPAWIRECCLTGKPGPCRKERVGEWEEGLRRHQEGRKVLKFLLCSMKECGLCDQGRKDEGRKRREPGEGGEAKGYAGKASEAVCSHSSTCSCTLCPSLSRSLPCRRKSSLMTVREYARGLSSKWRGR